MGAAGAKSAMIAPKVGRLELTRNGGTEIITQPDGTVLFSFVRAPAADDAIVTPEVSPDLKTWHSDESWLIPHSQERLPDGRLLTRYSSGPTLLASGPHVFFHLKITARP